MFGCWSLATASASTSRVQFGLRSKLPREDHLHGHEPMQADLPGLVDNAHAAPGDFFQQLEVVKSPRRPGNDGRDPLLRGRRFAGQAGSSPRPDRRTGFAMAGGGRSQSTALDDGLPVAGGTMVSRESPADGGSGAISVSAGSAGGTSPRNVSRRRPAVDRRASGRDTGYPINRS